MVDTRKESKLNREMSLELNEKFYEGTPCRKCNSTKRYTSNGVCSNCSKSNNGYKKEYYEKNKERKLEIERKWRQNQKETNGINFLANKIKNYAKLRELEFNLSKEYLNTLFIPKNCPCCNKELSWDENKWSNPSFDRVLNELGYIDGNILIVCFECNRMKNDITEEQMIFWLKRIKIAKKEIKLWKNR